jgi:hypothetical protein
LPGDQVLDAAAPAFVGVDRVVVRAGDDDMLQLHRAAEELHAVV